MSGGGHKDARGWSGGMAVVLVEFHVSPPTWQSGWEQVPHGCPLGSGIDVLSHDTTTGDRVARIHP